MMHSIILEYNDTVSESLPEYAIEFADGDIFGISEIERMVWKDGKAAKLSQQLYDEMYDIGLLKYYQMEDGKWKYRGIIYDQMIEMVGRTPNAVKDTRYKVLTNDPDITFDKIYKSFISSSLADGLDVNETIVVEIGVE